MSRSSSPKADVPAFARSFPTDPQLDALVQAFQAGNYAQVRKEAPELARSSTSSPEIQGAAKELLHRTQADPLMVWLLVITGFLLATLCLYWMTQPQHTHP
jgi:hypothetical protein